MLLILSARVVKTLMGYGTTFHTDVRRDVYYTCKEMVYAKMFYGGWCCFPGGMSSPSMPPQLEQASVYTL